MLGGYSAPAGSLLARARPRPYGEGGDSRTRPLQRHKHDTQRCVGRHCGMDVSPFSEAREDAARAADAPRQCFLADIRAAWLSATITHPVLLLSPRRRWREGRTRKTSQGRGRVDARSLGTIRIRAEGELLTRKACRCLIYFALSTAYSSTR
jgi:hypothetical protein